MSYPPIEFGQGWLQKNKVICVAVVAALVGTIACFVTFSMLYNSGPVPLAFERASASPALIERLGQPITKGWFVSENEETAGPPEKAALAITVSGPKGTGTLYVVAHKQAELWQLDLLQFGPKNSDERVDLLPPVPSQSPTAPSDRK